MDGLKEWTRLGGRPAPELVTAAGEQLDALLRRSATDLDFRRRLVAQPKATYTEFTGQVLPETFTLAFLENRPGAATVVLPRAVDPEAGLSDAELEVVSGGTTTPLCMIAAGIMIVAALINGIDKATSDSGGCDCC